MSQCKSITNENIQCRRNALLGRRYCFQHETVWVKRVTFIGIITVIITIIGFIADLNGLEIVNIRNSTTGLVNEDTGGLNGNSVNFDGDATNTIFIQGNGTIEHGSGDYTKLLPITVPDNESQFVSPLASPKEKWDKTRIIVTDFDGPDLREARITELIIGELQRRLGSYSNVEIEYQALKIDKYDDVESKMQTIKTDADVLIHGWYSITDEVVIVSTNYQIMRKLPYSVYLEESAVGSPKLHNPHEISSFELQFSLADELSYLGQYTLALMYFYQSDYEKVLLISTEALDGEYKYKSSDAVRSRLLNIRGSAHAAKGNNDLAEHNWQEAKVADPDYHKPYNNLGTLYFKSGKYEQAYAELEKAIKIKPDYIYAREGLGSAMIKHGISLNSNGEGIDGLRKIDKGIETLTKLIQDFPDYPSAYANRAIGYENQDNIESAITDLSNAILLNPLSSDYHARRANYHLQNRDYQKAITDYNTSIRLEPSCGFCNYYLRGQSHFAFGNYGSAIEDFNTALAQEDIEIPPDDIHYMRANAGMEIGNHDVALESVSELIERKSHFLHSISESNNQLVKLYKWRVQIFLHFERYEDALDDITYIINRNLEDQAFSLYNRAQVYVVMNDLEAAKQDLQAANEKTDNIELEQLIAQLLEKLE